MGNYGPDYLGFSYCCDGRCTLPKITTKLSLQIEKWKKTGNARDEANTNSAIFQELEKTRCHCDGAGYVTNDQLLRRYTLPPKGKYMSRQLFEDKDLHDLSGFDTSICTSTKTRRTTRRLQQDYSGHLMLLNHLHKFASVILKAGHVGQSSVVMLNKIDPKLVKFKAAGDKLLGIYWLPYFSTGEEDQSRAFHWKLKSLSIAPLSFVDLEPDFEGLKLFKNLVLQKTWKTGITIGEAIIRKFGLIE